MFEVHLFLGVVVKSSRTNCFKYRRYPSLELFLFNNIFENSRRLNDDFSISWLQVIFVLILRLGFWDLFFIHDCLEHSEKVSVLVFFIIKVELVRLTNGKYGILVILSSSFDSRMFLGSSLWCAYFEVSRFHFSIKEKIYNKTNFILLITNMILEIKYCVRCIK